MTLAQPGRLKVLLAATALAAGGLVALPLVAQGAPGGPMTAVSGAFAGTDGDDLLVLARDADLLSHNRYAVGDPGFESPTDFDSTAEGVQTLAVGSSAVQFSLGAGDDTVKIVGQLANPIGTGTSVDYGTGLDTLDVSDFSGASGHEGYGITAGPTLEKFIGTPFSDHFSPGHDGNPVPPLTVLAGAGDDLVRGGPGNDTLDGGPGDNAIHGGGGDDTIAVDAPFPPTRRNIDTYGGHNTVIFRGSSAADVLGVGVVPTEGGPQLVGVDAAHPDGGYSFSYDVAAVRVELGAGDDTLYLDPIAPAVVDGGDGSDNIQVNAYAATAEMTTDAGDRVVTLPRTLYFADGPLVALRLARTESLAVFNETVIVTAPGPGGGPHVRTFRADGTPVASFFAYVPSFTGGVSVALGDLDGDFDDEIVTGAGPGGGPHVRVFRSDGSDTGVGFFAYDPNFHGGVNVAAIDLDGDGFSEILTVPAQGGGPHVRVWSGDGELLIEWMAEGFSNTGLRVARGSTFGDFGGNQILVSASSGSSLVAAFEADGYPAPQFDNLSPYPGFGGGASVARAEIDAGPLRGRNGYHDEIVTAAGAGGGPHVAVFETSVYADDPNYTTVSSFYAYDADFHGGVDIATCNPDGLDDEIVTAAGPGGGPHVRMFAGKTGTPLAMSFFAYAPNFHGGVRVACGGAETKAY